jgi:hypothetical protein
MPLMLVATEPRNAATHSQNFLDDNLLFQSIVFVLSVSLFLYPPNSKRDNRLGTTTRKHALDEGVRGYLIDTKNHDHSDRETENKRCKSYEYFIDGVKLHFVTHKTIKDITPNAINSKRNMIEPMSSSVICLYSPNCPLSA